MSITRPMGFRAAAATAGIKPSGKSDLALIVCDESPRRSAAAVFTKNAVVGAPVEIGRAWRSGVVRGGPALRALLVNAGCSNAATGQPGIEDARATMRCVAEHLSCTMDEVLPSSTGIIGHRLPVDKINGAVGGLIKSLGRGEEVDDAVARAIMTTDLVPKSAHRELEIAGKQVHLGAVAKGSGMIAPQLDSFGRPAPHATMLAFITTDAAIEPACLQLALEDASRESFDRVSVDAHPSCSDTAVVLASGAAGIKTVARGTPEFHVFTAALRALCQDLATKIVRDGEGATRLFRVEVRGAPSDADASRIARAVVDSPLVKCAIHGKDPNWGRIVTAAGNAGVPFDTARASLTLGGVEVYAAGVPTGVARTDPRLKAAMTADPVLAVLTVGYGPGNAWMLGCDLSKDYVSINADYTT